MIQRSEFAQWRNSEVYEEFRKHFQERMGEFAADVMNRKVPDGPRDMLMRGHVQMLAEVLEWEPEFPPLVDQGEDDEA